MNRRHNPPNARDTARRFLKHHLGKDCFAPFTGQDASAWTAFVYACELYGRADDRGRGITVIAMETLLQAAQPKLAWEFLWTIPAILDWSHADEIWPLICGDLDGLALLAELHKAQPLHYPTKAVLQ